MIKQVRMLILINFLNFLKTFPHSDLAALQAEAQVTKQSVPALQFTKRNSSKRDNNFHFTKR